MSFVLPLHPPLAEALRQVALAEADAAIAALEAGGATGIHEMRKHCKKLRALLHLVRGLDRGAVSAIEHRVREAAGRLGSARDQTVRAQTLRELRRRHPELARIRAPRGTIHGSGDVPDTPALALDRLREAREGLKHLPLDRLSASTLERALRDSYRQARSAWHRAGADPGAAERLHRWRKRTKRLGYQCQLLTPLWPGLAGPIQKHLDTLGEHLGEHHDRAELLACLGRARGTGIASADAISEPLRRELEHLAEHAVREGATLFATPARRWNT